MKPYEYKFNYFKHGFLEVLLSLDESKHPFLAGISFCVCKTIKTLLCKKNLKTVDYYFFVEESRNFTSVE